MFAEGKHTTKAATGTYHKYSEWYKQAACSLARMSTIRGVAREFVMGADVDTRAKTLSGWMKAYRAHTHMTDTPATETQVTDTPKMKTVSVLSGKKRPGASTGGEKKKRKVTECAICGGLNHNRRTCPKNKK